ncbi:hypothetical protein BXU01_09635 [[Flexibacter] sp. ATCC 35103]|nr:hypothetical protein BXU01_09635 [[Flexibacter] sp. ATCC 35103]
MLVLISCKKEKKIVEKSAKDNYEISIVFPDTVFINKPYNGKINYKNSLDTITTTLDDIHKARFIEYAFIKTQTINYSDKYLKKIVTDTFVTRNNREIPLYNIRFNHLGLNYIDGIITDKVMIEIGEEDEKGNILTRIITDEFRFTKKVFVINNRTKK